MYFESFDSVEEMFDRMREATDRANDQLHAKQKTITWGSYWVRFEPAQELIIFGHVFDKQEFLDGEREAGATEEELEYTLSHYQENHDRGYMFGRAFSVWEPSGELGDTHRLNMWPITHAQFNEAREAAWVPIDMPGLHTWLADAYSEYRSHILSTMR